MSLPFLVRVMSENVASTFGLEAKGSLEPGTHADIVVFDPDDGGTVRAADNASVAYHSIYEGMDVSGSVSKTFVRGTLVADDGEVVAENGHGEFVERAVVGRLAVLAAGYRYGRCSGVSDTAKRVSL